VGRGRNAKGGTLACAGFKKSSKIELVIDA